jgi:hypothetical protein
MNPPLTSIVVSLSIGSRERIAASTASASVAVGTRTSTCARTSGATTFAPSPPSIVPTLTVIPRPGSFRENSR